MNVAEPVRRVVTGHDDNARAVIRSDDSFVPQPIRSGDAAFALLWRTVGDEPCRIVFVLTPAAAYRHNGKPLPEVQP